jgi:hypothetical protein
MANNLSDTQQSCSNAQSIFPAITRSINGAAIKFHISMLKSFLKKKID